MYKTVSKIKIKVQFTRKRNSVVFWGFGVNLDFIFAQPPSPSQHVPSARAKRCCLR